MLPESHDLTKWIGGEGIYFFFQQPQKKKKIYVSFFVTENYLLRIQDYLDVWVGGATSILTVAEKKRS